LKTALKELSKRPPPVKKKEKRIVFIELARVSANPGQLKINRSILDAID
jgi:hypothetical protein